MSRHVLEICVCQLYSEAQKERGVCLAATPKDCHKAINSTTHHHLSFSLFRIPNPPPSQPPSQPGSAPTMSAFISGGVIRPLVARRSRCGSSVCLRAQMERQTHSLPPQAPERRSAAAGGGQLVSHLLALLAEQKQKKQIEAINRRVQSNKQRVEGWEWGGERRGGD